MKQTRLQRTIAMLKRRYTTALECAQNGGVLSLSQRVGREIEAKYEVSRQWVKTGGGAKVMAYRIVGERSRVV